MRQFNYTAGEAVQAPRPALVGPGESAIPLAPVLHLQDNQMCIPQHYLRYAHSLSTVEAIIERISYDARYPIFASADTGGIYIQIGIVGPDNYKNSKNKLVYGRKWRVEPNLPTSEIIQTAFLAIKKAREHELRERFVLICGGRKTTPFNGHQDLPHMARHAACFTRQPAILSPHDVIRQIVFDGVSFEILSIIELPTGQAVVSLAASGDTRGEFAQLCENGLSFICENLSASKLIHGVFDACLKLSDRHVDEYFCFENFARFSHGVNVFEIAKLSSKQRQCPTRYLPKDKASEFIGQLTSENYETDETRIPKISNTPRNRELCLDLTAMAVTPPPIS